MLALIGRKVRSLRDDARRTFVYRRLYNKYKAYTMIRPNAYINNLAIVNEYRHVPGCVIECGTWRGGMIAGIAEVLGPDRQYFLFDSYQGLPPARTIDGQAAVAWQENKTGEFYHDNCKAEEESARDAMSLSEAKHVTVVKGWFNETLPSMALPSKIAVLRLDSDWFESTLTCLEALYPQMSEQGVVVLDDYYTWDGCSRAVHHYLAKHGYAARIGQTHGICTIRPNFAAEVAFK
jgi:O-methyltransferase